MDTIKKIVIEIFFLFTVLLTVSSFLVLMPALSSLSLFMSASIVHVAIWNGGKLGFWDRFFVAACSVFLGLLLLFALQWSYTNFSHLIISSTRSTSYVDSIFISVAILMIMECFAWAIAFSFCRSILSKLTREKLLKSEDLLVATNATQKGICEICGKDYYSSDYRDDVKIWYCGKCKNVIKNLQ